jgi:hypothetical protein
MSSSTMAWTSLYHLGDLSLTLPMAGAITVWLLAERAWRAALVWGAVFGLALALVAATKIAFMGWDTGLPALRYQALSGHATGFTAVFTTACYLLTQRYGHQARGGAGGPLPAGRASCRRHAGAGRARNHGRTAGLRRQCLGDRLAADRLLDGQAGARPIREPCALFLGPMLAAPDPRPHQGR